MKFIREIMHSHEAFSVKDMFLKGWETTKGYWLRVLLLILADIVFSGIIFALIGAVATQSAIIAIVIAILWFISQMMFSISCVRFFLAALRGEPDPFKGIFSKFTPQLVFTYTVCTIVYLILMTIGYILFVVPGIYFTLAYIYANLLIVDKNLSVREALRESKSMVKPHLFEMVAYLATVYAIAYILIVPFYYVAYIVMLSSFGISAAMIAASETSAFGGTIVGAAAMGIMLIIAIIIMIPIYMITVFGLGHIYKKLLKT